MKKQYEKHETNANRDALASKTRTLSAKLNTWRLVQKTVMPVTYAMNCSDDGVQQYSELDDSLDEEILLLSSDLPEGHSEDQFQELRKQEAELRFSELSGIISELRLTVKMIGTRLHEQAVQSRGQTAATRNMQLNARLFQQRDLLIDMYNRSRQKLITLETFEGIVSSRCSRLPALTINDTRRAAPGVRRVVGASRYVDGPLWVGTPSDRGHKPFEGVEIEDEDERLSIDENMSTRKRASKPLEPVIRH